MVCDISNELYVLSLSLGEGVENTRVEYKSYEESLVSELKIPHTSPLILATTYS
jgi:hypothetical protein